MDDFERPKASKLDDEDVLQPDDVTPTEEVLSQLDTEMPTETSQSPAPEQLLTRNKSKKKVRLIVSVVVLLLALVISGVTWCVLANKAPQGGTNEDMAGQPSESGNEDDNENPASEPGPKDEIVELNVDDELVQRLWGYFNAGLFPNAAANSAGSASSFTPLDKFYSNEGALSSSGLADPYKFAIAIQNLAVYGEKELEQCKGDYFRWTDDTGIEHPSTGMKACYSGDLIHSKIKEIFGTDISFEQFDNQVFIANGDGWKYSIKNDEIVDYVGGATRRLISRALLKAERNNNHIYIFEAVGYVGCWMMDQDICPASKLDGTKIVGGENITVGNMREFADYFDKFKWTFVWNGENYVFERLERI